LCGSHFSKELIDQHFSGNRICSNALFIWLISHQPVVLFSQNKPSTSNQPAVLFSQNKSAPAISHQPNEQAGKLKNRVVKFCQMPKVSRDGHFSLLSSSVTLDKGFIECLSIIDFLILVVYLLQSSFVLSGDDEGWNCLLHCGSAEDEGDNFGVIIFIDMMTWRLLYPDGGIKKHIMLPLWNNFL
jgi:hypothetical protein